MTYSIGLYFDPQTETEIRRIWQIMAENAIEEYLYSSANRPHITLTIFEDLDTTKAENLLRDFALRHTPFPISFQAIGLFPSTAAIFLNPVVTGQLLNIQRELHNLLVPFAALPEFPYYLPDQWIPHCGLAIEMPPENLLPAMKTAINNLVLPLNAEVREIGLTSFRPVVHLLGYRLGGEQYCC